MFVEFFIIALAVLGTFFLRPFVYGQTFTALGVLIAIFVAALSLVRSSSREYRLDHRYWAVPGAILGLWIFLITHSLLMEAPQHEFAVKAFIAMVAVICSYALLLHTAEMNYRFFRAIYWTMTALSASSIASCIFLQFTDVSTLLVTEIHYDYSRPLALILPISTLYHVASTSIGYVPRFSMFLREVGIAPVFLLWALVYGFAWRMPLVSRLILIGGTLMTFSTTGAMLLLVTLGGIGLAKSRNSFVLFFGLPLLVITTWLASDSIPVVGFNEKMASMSISVDERREASERGLAAMLDQPIGVGLYGDSDPAALITLLAALKSIGVVGLLLTLTSYLSPLLIANQDRQIVLISILPLIATSAFAQPLLDAPAVNILLLSAFPASTSRFAGERRARRHSREILHRVE